MSDDTRTPPPPPPAPDADGAGSKCYCGRALGVDGGTVWCEGCGASPALCRCDRVGADADGRREAMPNNITIDGPDAMETAWRALAHALSANNPKWSPVRAGEVAAARLVVEMDERLVAIESALWLMQTGGGGEVPLSDRDLYNRICVDGWSYRDQLIRLSGSRTLTADVDDQRLAAPPAGAPAAQDARSGLTGGGDETQGG